MDGIVRAIGVSSLNELEEYRDPGRGDDPPVTAVASRRVKPGREDEFEQWTSGILSAANGFPGYLGSNMVRPSGPEDDEYQIVFKFDMRVTSSVGKSQRNAAAGSASPRTSSRRSPTSGSSPALRPGLRFPPRREIHPRRATRWR